MSNQSKQNKHNAKQTTPIKPMAVEIGEAMSVSLDDCIDRFAAKFSAGMEAIQDAARIYVEALQRHPSKAAEAFAKRYPTVSDRTWETLRHIGSGDLHPAALMLNPKVTAVVQKMGRKQQDYLFRESANGIHVLSPSFKELTVELPNLTTSQLAIAFNPNTGRLRTIEEQREMQLKARQSVGSGRGRLPKHPPYVICGNTLRVGRTEIGIAELESIVKTIRGSQKKG